MRRDAAIVLALGLLGSLSCSRFGPVYPARPEPSQGAPVADPAPSRMVLHLAVTAAALRQAIDDAVPKTGDGTFPLLGSDRKYTWERGPIDLAIAHDAFVLTTTVRAKLAVPLHPVEVAFDVRVHGEPVVSSAYAVKLQSVDVHVASSDRGLAIANAIGGVYGKVADGIVTTLKDFSYDLRPMLSEAYARVSRPITFPIGDASACAQLHVLEVEAGPTVLADGFEKDLALVVAPSITLPCPASTEASAPELPPMSNVASLTPGPFTVTFPIAARYDELTRAMTAAFTDGKLFFSKEYPELYLEKPEVYESQGQLVVSLHIRGPVHKLGIDAPLDGQLYLTGRPAVVDNELSVPDLEPTIETKSFLLSLKAMTDGATIREEARKALRLDVGARLAEARELVGDRLTFGADAACFHGDVDRVEVTGVYPHAAYLRIVVAVTGRARATVPCSEPPATTAVVAP